MSDKNGSQSQERVKRPYVVLEQSSLFDAVRELLEGASLVSNFTEDEMAALKGQCERKTAFIEVGRVPSRNASHALSQVGRQYAPTSASTGITPPLVAVSERMFKPRRVKVEMEARVSLS